MHLKSRTIEVAFQRVVWIFVMLVNNLDLRSDMCLAIASSSVKYFTAQPRTQAVLVNETVTFDCIIGGITADDDNCTVTVTWYKDEVNLSDRISSDLRYHISGFTENGDYSLTIENATRDDVGKGKQGRFKCLIKFWLNETQELESPPAFLIVEYLPTIPVIISEIPVRAAVGETVRLGCESRGYPAPVITWLDSSGHKIEEGVIPEYVDSYPTVIMTSIRTFSVNKSHRDQAITCEVRSSLLPPAIRNRDVSHEIWQTDPIEIYVLPKICLGVQYPSSKFAYLNESLSEDEDKLLETVEGANITLKCSSDVDPNVTSYRWFFDSEEVLKKMQLIVGVCAETTLDEEGQGSILTMYEVPKELNNTRVTCEGENAVGRSFANLTILVTPRNPADQSERSEHPSSRLWNCSRCCEGIEITDWLLTVLMIVNLLVNF